MQAYLALEDGTIFTGEAFGGWNKEKIAGEVVFNTSMTGYQEVLTDPSYAGEIVTMTYPLIGNYGINEHDFESGGPKVEAFVVREYCEVPSNWRTKDSLDEFLKKHQIPGIAGIDTRALTKRLRNYGTMRGLLAREGAGISTEKLLQEVRETPDISGMDLVPTVTIKKPYTLPGEGYHVVLIDFGTKQNIIRCLYPKKRIGDPTSMSLDNNQERAYGDGCKLTVVPANMASEEIIKLNPHGVVLSNGPGDPKQVPYAVETTKKLLGRVPIFGICLGHQILGMAAGGTTYKLPFGHRGGNHPVKDLKTGKVYITSQNHGFAVDADSLKGEAEVSHLNLNDNTVEGLRFRDVPAFSVQYHPESSPGPTDSEYLFHHFFDMMQDFWGKEGKHA